MTNGYIIGDGSWTLTIKVTDFGLERRLRVKGDLHIGGVMLRLVEDLGKYLLSVYNFIKSKVVGYMVSSDGTPYQKNDGNWSAICSKYTWL